MSKMAHGYGSEWHLSHYLKNNLVTLNNDILKKTGGEAINWLVRPEGEWQGLDFLPEDLPARKAWLTFWPQTGNCHNWDAVGWLQNDGSKELLLVEAKAHVEELQSHCGAKAEGGLTKIIKALQQTRAAMGIALPDERWLGPYYQFCNRLAMLHFLAAHDVPARLIYIYFLGDQVPNRKCPTNSEEWESELQKMYQYVGLTRSSELEKRVHRVFLNVVEQPGSATPVVSRCI